ncbi:hypothetical protein GTE6_56 [Gordonia phage GTE6]|uniref:Uncharacterized protein n=1 Tax=Gordonia phage GTE6 TaxID=1647474 RepID=A0A0K0MXC5_9CAUD|nr:hypothetical protein AU100_gp56 [Gordonia phage GTE6]AKI28698.1 hypothetical protein GTE6_56 [Gordonia phage GTE6]
MTVEQDEQQAVECGRVAWLASVGARATVCCTQLQGHDGKHHDAALGVDWSDDE